MIFDPELANLLLVRAGLGLLLGLVMGSFATMASYRLPRRLSLVAPPSACPACGHRLGVRDLFPVFSWLFARGRCRHCAQKIPARYPLIELATALLFVALFAFVGWQWIVVPASFAALALVIFMTIKLES